MRNAQTVDTRPSIKEELLQVYMHKRSGWAVEALHGVVFKNAIRIANLGQNAQVGEKNPSVIFSLLYMSELLVCYCD